MAAGLRVRQTGGQGARCMMGVGVVVVSRRSNCVVVWLRDGRCRVTDHGDTQHRGWLTVTLASSNQRTVREGSGEECIPHSQEVRMAAGLYARQR
jgi:hypothetical protein